MTIKDIKFDYPLGSKFKKLGGNLYKITTEGAVIVRFHNTDIVKKEGGKIILNSGGWLTATTKKHINKFLPDYIYIFQKNFAWFLKNTYTGETKDFCDGIAI